MVKFYESNRTVNEETETEEYNISITVDTLYEVTAIIGYIEKLKAEGDYIRSIIAK